MRKVILIAAVLGVFGMVVYAEQSYEAFGETFGYGSEESGTSSYLGVDINEVTADRLGALKLKEEHGVEVTMVDQDAPAGKAGLKEHDVILALNGTPVESGAQLRRLIRETPPGRIVTLSVSRDGQPLSVKVQLADRRKSMGWGPNSKEFKFSVPPVPPVPEFDVPVSVVVVHSSMRSGLMVENITPQLGEFFGVKNGNGVLIRSVEKGSRAEKAGFRAGDVVVRVNDQAIHDASDFTHALRSRDSKALTIGIVREKKEQNLTLTLPERKESGALIDEDLTTDIDIEALEDSLDIPDVDVSVDVQRLADIQAEVARMQPQIQLAIEESQRAQHEVSKTCADKKRIQERQRELKQRADELKERFQQRQQEMQQREREIQEQQQEMQELQQEMRQQQILEEQREIQENFDQQRFGNQLPI